MVDDGVEPAGIIVEEDSSFIVELVDVIPATASRGSAGGEERTS